MAALPFQTLQHSTLTTAKIAVLSVRVDGSNNPIVPTLTVSMGVITDTTPTVVEAGTDGLGTIFDSSGYNPEDVNGIAMYVWVFAITGLTAGTFGSYTAVQGSESITGSFNTMPASDASDFTIIDLNCDGSNGNSTDKGAWGYIRGLCETENVPVICHPDDNGYVDGLLANDADGNLRFIFTKAATQETEYSFVVAYAAYLGLLESSYHGAADAQSQIDNKTRFLDPDRIWCFQNRPFIRVPGDHEMLNDAGRINSSGVSAAPSPEVLTAARNAWKNTIGILQNYAEPADAHAATYDKVGPAEIFGLDRVFGLEPDLVIWDDRIQVNTGGIAAHDPPTTSGRYLGSDQVAAIQGKIDSVSPFKVVLMTPGSRYVASLEERLAIIGDGYNQVTSAQQPLHDYTVDSNGDSEYTEIFSDANGIAGTFSITYEPHVMDWHGDTHRPHVNYFYLVPQNGHQKRIGIWEFGPGSVNANFPQGVSPGEMAPNDYRGNFTVWNPPGTNNEKTYLGNDTTHRRYNGCLVARISGSSGSYKMVISLMDITPSSNAAELLYTETFVEGKAHAPDYIRRGWN